MCLLFLFRCYLSFLWSNFRIRWRRTRRINCLLFRPCWNRWFGCARRSDKAGLGRTWSFGSKASGAAACETACGCSARHRSNRQGKNRVVRNCFVSWQACSLFLLHSVVSSAGISRVLTTESAILIDLWPQPNVGTWVATRACPCLLPWARRKAQCASQEQLFSCETFLTAWRGRSCGTGSPDAVSSFVQVHWIAYNY